MPNAWLFIYGSIYFISLPLIALMILTRGLRGKRVGDHPTCRACGFDLFGAPADSNNCPECGADLRSPHAILIGHLQRGRKKIVAGFALLLISLCLGFLSVRNSASLIVWGEFRPTWYALREASGSLPGDRVDAIAILINRADRDALSPESRNTLANVILAMQSDRMQAWKLSWGGWLSNEISRDTLTVAQRDAFFRTLFSNVKLDVRSKVNVGDPMPAELAVSLTRGIGSRASPRPSWSYLVGAQFWKDIRLTLDGQPLPPPLGGGSGKSSLTTNTLSSQQTLRLETPLSVGTHTLRFETIVHIRRSFAESESDIASYPVTAETTFEVVDKSTPLVQPVANELFRAGMQKALQADDGGIRMSRTGKSAQLMITCDRDTLPADVAFDVVVRQGDLSRQVGAFSAKAGGGQAGHGYGFDAAGLQAGVADIHLVPSAMAAKQTRDVFDFWDGEVVFRDVPVKVDDGDSR